MLLSADGVEAAEGEVAAEGEKVWRI